MGVSLLPGRVLLYREIPRPRRDQGDSEAAPASAEEEEQQRSSWSGSRAAGGHRGHPAQDPLQGQPQGFHLKNTR